MPFYLVLRASDCKIGDADYDHVCLAAKQLVGGAQTLAVNGTKVPVTISDNELRIHSDQIEDEEGVLCLMNDQPLRSLFKDHGMAEIVFRPNHGSYTILSFGRQRSGWTTYLEFSGTLAPLPFEEVIADANEILYPE